MIPAKLDYGVLVLVALGDRLRHKHRVGLADRRLVLLTMDIFLSGIRCWLIEHSLRDFETLPHLLGFSQFVQWQFSLCLLQFECVVS